MDLYDPYGGMMADYGQPSIVPGAIPSIDRMVATRSGAIHNEAPLCTMLLEAKSSWYTTHKGNWCLSLCIVGTQCHFPLRSDANDERMERWKENGKGKQLGFEKFGKGGWMRIGI
ncbi:Hypothetical predicted protein [Olea europaea subsp. europaea]|uniref:Uncharacterized protein n=1 Tax=Olea europaea subsp. europaea TaxID=158383 RepID=A0A8S0QHH3_OLEEU|nr:Hypothetical predicted protein [Olea europaea subsp. europaea]